MLHRIKQARDSRKTKKKKKIYLSSRRGRHRRLQPDGHRPCEAATDATFWLRHKPLRSELGCAQMPQMQTSPNRTCRRESLHALRSQRPTFCRRVGGRGGVAHLLKMALTAVSNDFRCYGLVFKWTIPNFSVHCKTNKIRNKRGALVI